MNPRQLRSVGILLGLLLLAMVTVRFSYSFRSGDVNWYYLVMICGMILLLFYTLEAQKEEKIAIRTGGFWRQYSFQV